LKTSAEDNKGVCEHLMKESQKFMSPNIEA